MSSNTPEPSAGRPPIVPPVSVAIGTLGGDDGQDPILRSVLHLVEQMRQRDAQGQLESSPSSRNVLDAIAALKVTAMDSGNLVTISEVAEVLERKRTDLQEQLELERLVARPPKKGYDLIHEQDDQPEALEKTLSLVNVILSTLERARNRTPLSDLENRE